MMSMKKKADEVLRLLELNIPVAKCELNYSNCFELLVAVILSAQCTDVRVNKVTPRLFRAYPTPSDMANADIEKLKKLIFSTGFYNNKAKNIIGMSKRLLENFDGKVPDIMHDLITLPGVARKTANIILYNCYHKNEGLAVDTHVKRITRLVGLTDEKNPDKIEQDLMKLFPREKWGYVSHALVLYGRYVCPAKKHDSSSCYLGH